MTRGGDSLALVNARLLDPASGLDAPGGLLVLDGRIADFGPAVFAAGTPPGIAVVDCDGHCLAPGLVDMRVRVGEPGEEHKENLASAALAAAAGGVTTLAALPDTDPPIDEPALVAFIARRAQEVGSVTVLPYATLTKRGAGKELAEIGMLREAGAVAFTDGARAIGDAQLMRRALSYAKAFGALIVQHPEEPSLAAGGAMNEGEFATRLGLPGIPALAEVIQVERDLRLLELTRGRLHFAHVSTEGAVAAIRAAKARGLAVTADTAPPYFDLNETAVGDYRTFAKLSPPLRTEADRLAIIAALADGTLDAVASDHNPQDQDTKRLPFTMASWGGIGLETLLAVTLNLVHNGALAMIEAVRLLTLAPAALLGQAEAGRLARGVPADLVLFDAERGWRVDADRLSSKSKNSPFDGRPVQGRVLRTIKAGRTVFQLAGRGPAD
ncbi:MAG: dihydroorotase [Alphaproteobacteria bacterium]|nr:dihydroorotase [Alphaproteobacteria bacterium]